MTSPTVLIGLDGATFTVLDDLMERGVMPFLRGFADEGVRANLRSIIPPLTPPAWTSLMTGLRPGQHGVFDFFHQESPENPYLRFATSHDIQAETIWGRASKAGQRIIALNFPLMFPPPEVHGSVVPGGWMPWRQLRLGCYPPGLFDRLKTLPSFEPRELALDMTLEEKAIEGCAASEYADWIALHLRRERRWFDVLRYLMRNEPAQLAAVMFDGVDKLQHLCWRFVDPALAPRLSTPWELEIRASCEGYFRQLDDLIAQICALAGPEATVVLASDHGFGPATDIFYVNRWLEENGYLRWSESAAPGDDSARIGFNQIARHVSQLDWDRTIAYASAPTSNGIHLVTRSAERANGIAPEDYARVRAELAAKVRQARHRATGRALVENVYLREEAFAGPHEASGPDLTLALADGVVMSILHASSVAVVRPEIGGTHRPEGIFLARGPAMRRGIQLDEISIVDVAPLILYTLDNAIPEGLAGRLPVAALEPDALNRRPPRYETETTASQPASALPTEGLFDAEAEETMLKRLRALGYVE